MQGRCWTFGDDINTDEIIPARYLNSTDPEELAPHCMEDADVRFATRAQKGDIILAGHNFGCGSSREHAALALKGFGISCVIARSFARIFFRNAINTALPIAECPEAVNSTGEGDRLEVNFQEGTIRNLTREQSFTFPPFPEEIRRIIDAGGLMAFARELARSQ